MRGPTTGISASHEGGPGGPSRSSIRPSLASAATFWATLGVAIAIGRTNARASSAVMSRAASVRRPPSRVSSHW